MFLEFKFKTLQGNKKFVTHLSGVFVKNKSMKTSHIYANEII